MRADDFDQAIPTSDGTRIGTAFSHVFSDMTAASCEPGMEVFSGRAVCFSPQLDNVVLVFAGSWNGPDDSLPPDDQLSDWTVETIIWNAPY